MGVNLVSTKYAAKVTSVSEETLRSWLGSGLFETEHFAKNTKTDEKTFYFSTNDINRLSEFASREIRKTRLDLAAD
jgi:hypothetical protein